MTFGKRRRIFKKLVQGMGSLNSGFLGTCVPTPLKVLSIQHFLCLLGSTKFKEYSTFQIEF